MLTVKEIVEKYMKENGLDALHSDVSDTEPCSCFLGVGLMDCEQESCKDCSPMKFIGCNMEDKK